MSKQGVGQNNTEDTFYTAWTCIYQYKGYFFSFLFCCCRCFAMETISYLRYGLSCSSINWAVICRLLLHLLSKPHSFRKLICQEWNHKWNAGHTQGWLINTIFLYRDETQIYDSIDDFIFLTSFLWVSFCSWLKIGKESRFCSDRLDLAFCSWMDRLREKTTGSSLSLTGSWGTQFSHVSMI